MGSNQGVRFFDLYIDYTSETECPTLFHRWSMVSSVGAYLGRQVSLRHGFFTLYPNLYTLLVGSPGTKKSSAIKIATSIIKDAGYKSFGARKTRQEKFLMDLAEQSEDSEDILDQNIFGDVDDSKVSECFVAADEFNNFIGVGNMDFMSILGELWDYSGTYDYKLKNSKSVHIPNPTISILGGNTQTGMAQAFPTEAIGQGFFSRLLLVYSDPSGLKITFPPPPDEQLKHEIVTHLMRIKSSMFGAMDMTADAEKLLDTIYKEWNVIDDVRFEAYANRRLPQLLKLCLICAAADLKKEIDVDTVIYANTLLTYTELSMPKALGEFGKAKHSGATHKVMTVLDSTDKPLTLYDLWKHVSNDLERRDQLIDIMGNLSMAGKVQTVKGGGGYLPVRKIVKDNITGVDFSLFKEITI